MIVGLKLAMSSDEVTSLLNERIERIRAIRWVTHPVDVSAALRGTCCPGE